MTLVCICGTAIICAAFLSPPGKKTLYRMKKSGRARNWICYTMCAINSESIKYRRKFLNARWDYYQRMCQFLINLTLVRNEVKFSSTQNGWWSLGYVTMKRSQRSSTVTCRVCQRNVTAVEPEPETEWFIGFSRRFFPAVWKIGIALMMNIEESTRPSSEKQNTRLRVCIVVIERVRSWMSMRSEWYRIWSCSRSDPPSCFGRTSNLKQSQGQRDCSCAPWPRDGVFKWLNTRRKPEIVFSLRPKNLGIVASQPRYGSAQPGNFIYFNCL